MNYLNKIINLLTDSEYKKARYLFVIILITALLDMIGVASIMPFMAVLANPQILETNLFLNKIFKILNFDNNQQFLFVLGGAVFILLIFSLALKALSTYMQLRFALHREYSIGKRLIEGYLHQPYSWFLNHNSAELGRKILSETHAVVHGCIIPMMNLIAQGSVVLSLLLMLVWVDPFLSLSVGIVLGLAYVLIYRFSRDYIAHIGKDCVLANKERFIAVNEAFGSAKELKVGGFEEVYVNRFAIPAQVYAEHQATSHVIGQLPRFALEATAFGGILLVTMYLLAQDGNFSSALPIIAVYVFAGYRLMPALQQVYSSIMLLRFSSASLDSLYRDLVSLKSLELDFEQTPLNFESSIKLNNVSYTYPKRDGHTLKNINLCIPVGSCVGFIGVTGSGKSTIIDIILGLLEPQQGTLQIDEHVITRHNHRSWQRLIGYVPQQIYLADNTVAANIAFGVDQQKINLKAVERAAKIANLHEFVIDDLPNGYQTKIGERGIRLSGGQRQRIGIARALYHWPKVLILDEATSALDNLTEYAVMEAVQNFEQDITIILVAHRLSTVKKCDTIFLLEEGQIKASGTFDELSLSNPIFKKMTGTLI
jgi:ABC-type multidrug transport system fused ATPase/permease subunit